MITVAPHESALLGSDFHLSDQEPDTAQRVLEALQEHGAQCDHLFLLGDLFEVWVGDDGADATARALAEVLQGLSRRDVRIWMMRGNRDFLLGEHFVHQCGARLLDDPTLVLMHGQPVLLMHGDSLCTDDLVYQQWRSTCRHPAWQAGFLSRPLEERQLLGRQAREASEAGKRERGEGLMDVNARAVVQALQHAGCSWLIHGHTHRPADHHWNEAGRALRRTVLSDWTAHPKRGTFLRLSHAGLEAKG